MTMQTGLVATQTNINLQCFQLTTPDGREVRGLKQGQGIVHGNSI